MMTSNRAFDPDDVHISTVGSVNTTNSNNDRRHNNDQNNQGESTNGANEKTHLSNAGIHTYFSDEKVLIPEIESVSSLYSQFSFKFNNRLCELF